MGVYHCRRADAVFLRDSFYYFEDSVYRNFEFKILGLAVVGALGVACGEHCGTA